jgi:uncharacterized protein (UPF0332 family)
MSPEVWMEHAQLRLEAARLLFQEAFYGEALSRLYFSVFAASKALLATHAIEASTHAGVHTLLYRHFADTVDTRLYNALQDDRNNNDYRLRIPDRAYAQKRLEQATAFTAGIEVQM